MLMKRHVCKEEKKIVSKWEAIVVLPGIEGCYTSEGARQKCLGEAKSNFVKELKKETDGMTEREVWDFLVDLVEKVTLSIATFSLERFKVLAWTEVDFIPTLIKMGKDYMGHGVNGSDWTVWNSMEGRKKSQDQKLKDQVKWDRILHYLEVLIARVLNLTNYSMLEGVKFN